MYNLYNEIKKCIDTIDLDKEYCTFYGRDIHSIADARFFSLVADQFISDEFFVQTLHRVTEDAMRSAVYQLYNSTPGTAEQYILLSLKNARYYKQSFLEIKKCILDNQKPKDDNPQTKNQEERHESKAQNQTDLFSILTGLYEPYNSTLRTQLESDKNQSKSDNADSISHKGMEREDCHIISDILYYNGNMDEHYIDKRGNPFNKNKSYIVCDNSCKFENNMHIASLLDIKRYLMDKTAVSSTLQTVMIDIINDNTFYDQMTEGRASQYNYIMSGVLYCDDIKVLMQRCLSLTNGDYQWCDAKLHPCLDIDIVI